VAWAGRTLRESSGFNPGRACARIASLGYAVPGTVLAIGLLTPFVWIDTAVAKVFGTGGLFLMGSMGALVCAYAIRFLAISTGALEAGLARIPPSLEQASRLLGESSAGTLRRVHLPLLRPALAASALLVFVDAMKELPATLLLRPMNFDTLATWLYAEAARGTYEEGAVAALAIVLGIGIPGIPSQWFISANAFIFALLAALLLDGITRWTQVASSGVILFGIALVFTFNALVSMLQFVANEDTLQGLVFWTMGSIDRASWQKVGILLAVLAVVMPLSMLSSWKLTALRLGEDRAMSFGINVRRLRLTTLLRISILSAISVAFVGPIGFIGLVAPHIARLIFGEDHRFYLPASALIGALVLSLASVASKNLIPGAIIPVGIVTSLVGVPFFLSIILRHRGNV